jgi:HAD superfamily hydrolase (TIGR01450 family)
MGNEAWNDPFFAAAGAVPGAGRPAPIRLVAVDLDGVVWLGGAILPDAVPALNEVVRRDFDLRYVTNNATAHRDTVSERLAAAGLPAGADRVLTSGYVAARWLRERLPEGAPVLVIGEPGLMRELTEAGLQPVHAGEEVGVAPGAGAALGAALGAAATGPVAASPAVPAPGGAAPVPDTPPGAAAAPAPLTPPGSGATPANAPSGAPFQAVVAGMDRNFTFKMLAQAQSAILGGALFVGTNPDPTFPTPAGLLPGAGSVVTAVATASQKEPVYMGKPGLGLAEILAKLTGVPAGQTLFIGDRLSTDIGMGIRAGMVTALVLTGITSPTDLERVQAAGGPNLPDYVLRTLADLPPLLDRLGPSPPA